MLYLATIAEAEDITIKLFYYPVHVKYVVPHHTEILPRIIMANKDKIHPFQKR